MNLDGAIKENLALMIRGKVIGGLLGNLIRDFCTNFGSCLFVKVELTTLEGYSTCQDKGISQLLII